MTPQNLPQVILTFPSEAGLRMGVDSDLSSGTNLAMMQER